MDSTIGTPPEACSHAQSTWEMDFSPFQFQIEIRQCWQYAIIVSCLELSL
jgi:hypothetical protein